VAGGARRIVRVRPTFFEDLDRQLSPERGTAGEPSAHDFLALDLLRAVEEFATAFDDLPPLIADLDDYRVLISSGVLLPRFSIVGQLADDGAVELVELEIDLESGWS
jgi:predicted KAP-like P-loop ATPase